MEQVMQKRFLKSHCPLSEEQQRAVVGLHAFSGNDYIARFFRKGKKTCWRTASKGFMELFSCLGETYNLDQNQKDEIEKFVCALYGKPKLKKVNEARAAIFWGKYNQSKKIADLSMLPPCQGNLMLHLKRANYVAYNMRHSCELRPIKEEYSHHGWTEDERPVWVESLLPDNVENVLIEQEGTQNDADDESDLDDDEEIHEFDDDDISLEDFS